MGFKVGQMKRMGRYVQSWASSREEVRLRFQCTGCGKCCTGEGGRVRVNDRELQELATATNLSLMDFKQRYTHTVVEVDAGGQKQVQHVLQQTRDDRQCIFLQGSKCTVYAARPTQCRTFPWWPQHLVSDYDWHLAAKECEGIRMEQEEDGHEDVSSVSFDDVIPDMVVHDIHQSGENFTYNELQQMLQDLKEVEPELLMQYKTDFFHKFSRRIVFYDDEVTVLDNLINGVATRSLVFTDRLHLTQSEVVMNQMSDADTNVDPKFDRTTLAFDVHRALCMPFAWFPDCDGKSLPLHVSVLGAGACTLPLFLLEHLSPEELKRLDAVEPSSQVNSIAQHFFGVREVLQRDERLVIHEKKGEDFLKEQSKSAAFDLLVLDVEAGTDCAGVRAPPLAMLEPKFLYRTKCVLASHGILAINVITESKAALENVETKLGHVFTRGLRLSLPANTTFFLFNNKCDNKTSFAVDEFIRRVQNNSFQTEHAKTPALLNTYQLTAWISNSLNGGSKSK
ncbi:hypothetical protein DD238_004548 [Peronospora effusa]|uniref:Uncharacterized protein n=1 Tax=Peronospora effusa TaxID=542832 RepID=A0A3M6VCG4_9STRA|nr:hypothetical protein DD238_004548 [Peronospora effusa]